MNLSRRKLLLGAAAVAVAPALPPIAAEAAAMWTPNPMTATEALARQEIFYGGAAGGGKSVAVETWLRECTRILGERTGLTGQFQLVTKDQYERTMRMLTPEPQPWFSVQDGD